MKHEIKLIFCACGCGEKIPNRDKNGVKRRYVHGHNMIVSADKRFWAKVKKSKEKNGCWEWTGCKYKSGAGQFRYNRKNVLAHNFVWMLRCGEIPKGKRVMQQCGNRSCIRSDHLFLENDDWETRFWKYVKKCENGCWEWNGHNRNRYGLFARIRGVTESAHRIMWELKNGPIPEGKQVLHKCDNPPCCRPDHLFLGTITDNMADMVKKGRQYKKIEDEDVVEIRQRYAKGGISQRKLGAEFGIKQMQVSGIVRRVRRKGVC